MNSNDTGHYGFFFRSRRIYYVRFGLLTRDVILLRTDDRKPRKLHNIKKKTRTGFQCADQ